MTAETMTAEMWTKPLFFDLDKVENIAEEEAAITLDYTPPVILPEDSKLETNSLLEAHEPEPVTLPKISPIAQKKSSPPMTMSPFLWLLGSLGLLFILMLLVDAYNFVVLQYTSSIFLGTLFLSVILVISGTVFILGWRSYQSIKALRTVEKLQKEGQLLMEANGYGETIHYANRVANFYADRPDVKTRLERFYLTLTDTHHDREACALFSDIVLKDMDQQAYRIVTQRSKETALMVMISPIAWLDMLLTLWRNVRMIRDIATLYGGRPGFLGSMSLITAVLQNLIYADVSELVAESVAEILGGSMLSIMSAQAAQGLGSGVMTARVGLQAIKACRPLPFSEEEKPRLRDIRREVVKSLKGIFETKEAQVKTA
ncbi:TIGR01620 family protein [Candidatus Parabeggiatoa sp. HSG14]|uniref:TIGR01620 family protein n=1 Tax=Candidatus Parabeggiatoa sp. HSG14 TaxID=3055593 RepID=UPI0025A72C3D|nr:TIGR01620 family protein [Thiotrichales bacterium HSG14]